MARRYVRDARGRFAPKGYSGQTGGRGARLKTKGNVRAGGGRRTTRGSGKPEGTISGTKRGRSSDAAERMIRRDMAAKAKPKVSSAREQATNRLKLRTAAKRRLIADRGSVIPAQPKARRIRSQRPASTVAKPRTKGNDPRTVARRVDRKAAVNQANINQIVRYERTGATQGRQYQRALKTQATLKRAQDFTRTGQLPGRDNSIRAQRERRAASQRLAAKNAERRAARQRGDSASVNVPMRGSRGRRLDAEITRNVTQQRTAKRAESRARNAQFKSDQSRAKALRGKYGDQLAKDFAVKSGRKVSEVKATIKGMAPAQQVKLLTKAGRQQRAQANLARTADTRGQAGSTQIRRPSPKQRRGNLKATQALEFYNDPKARLREVRKNRPGFRMPRSMR